MTPPAPRVPRPPGTPPNQPGPGVFVPQHVIVTLISVIAGIMTGLLVWAIPTVWLPVGAGMTVTALALALYALWHGRHHR